MLGIFPILAERRRQDARDLSGGQQQLLALAQAFLAEPRILLCDEPSLGVAHRLVGPILDFLRKQADGGVTVVVVEQAVEQALERADRVVVIRQGNVVAEGAPSEFDTVRLRQLFLGDLTVRRCGGRGPAAELVLSRARARDTNLPGTPTRGYPPLSIDEQARGPGRRTRRRGREPTFLRTRARVRDANHSRNRLRRRAVTEAVTSELPAT